MINDDNVKEGSQSAFKSIIPEVIKPIISTVCTFGFYATAVSTPAFATERILSLAEICIGLSLIWLFFATAKTYKSR